MAMDTSHLLIRLPEMKKDYYTKHLRASKMMAETKIHHSSANIENYISTTHTHASREPAIEINNELKHLNLIEVK